MSKRTSTRFAIRHRTSSGRKIGRCPLGRRSRPLLRTARYALAASQRSGYPQIHRVQPREDLGNGYVTRKPRKKTTSVQVIRESGPDDAGVVRLRINPENAGPAPRIYYAEDAIVSDASPQTKEQIMVTGALRVNFLVVDPSNQFETGEAVTWANKLVLRNFLHDPSGNRAVEILV